MANPPISISYRIIEDGNGLKTALLGTDGLRKMMQLSAEEAKKLESHFIDIAAKVTSFNSLKDSFSALKDQMQGFADLQRDVTLTTQLMGGGTDNIKELRDEIRSLSDYFSKDYSETLRGVNSLSKGFGISGAEAVSLMRDAMVSGADVNGDFIDTIREYPRYFKEAGISAEAFVAIATNAAKQGVFSDKGVDAIKEANLKLREMTNSTKDALNAYSTIVRRRRGRGRGL